ncbi:hypothetical protein PaeCFBP13512_03500 [Paenibacillus sp. CFBP13512]|nr:hypothetical protein PaeCFBP13512_03500 [Paenibacillus sp. CFBP13512]
MTILRFYKYNFNWDNEKEIYYRKGNIMKNRKWVIMPLVLLLVLLSGCQAVGNLDINSAMVGDLNVKSIETKQSLAVQLTPVSTASAEERKIATVLNGMQLNINHAKLQENGNVSVEGGIAYSGMTLPFQMFMDTKGVTIALSGAQKPLYIPLTTEEQMAFLPASLTMKQIEDQAKELITKSASLFFKHAPNPSNVTVDSVTQEVYGESVDLTHLHIELTGEEFIGLVKPFLTSISTDEAGWRDLLATLYDFITYAESQMSDEEKDSVSYFTLDQTKAEFVNESYAEVQSFLKDVLSEYDKYLKEVSAEPEFKTIFGTNTRLTLDLYFDKDMHTRKQIVDLTVALPSSEYVPYSMFNLHTENENWNVDGNIVADPIATPNGVLDVTSKDFTPGALLRSFDTTSPVYLLLHDVAGIANKSIYIDKDSSYSSYDVVTKDRVLLMSVKQLAEEFDAKFTWNPTTKTITLTDDITGAVTTLHLNSNKAVTDGTTKTMTHKVVKIKGVTYVPVRSVAEILGAKVTSESSYVVVERK